MAQKKLARHGSEAGYRAELRDDNVCERCRKGHQMYDRLGRKSRSKGTPKPDRFAVLDSQWTPAKSAPGQRAHRPAQSSPVNTGPGLHSGFQQSPVQSSPAPAPDPAPDAAEASSEPSIGQRLSDAMAHMIRPGADTDTDTGYVASDEMPDYLHTVDPDAEPQDPESSTVKQDDFVITRESMALIQDNLGTYLSVVGMTLEMLDPYCGPVLAENIDNMVYRWSKVITRYPAAAKLFMAKGGGVIMDWIGAIQATWPVLYAIYEHHLAKTIVTDKGRIMRVTPSANGRPVDATLPPQPDYEYTTQ